MLFVRHRYLLSLTFSSLNEYVSVKGMEDGLRRNVQIILTFPMHPYFEIGNVTFSFHTL